jgi:putative addiction module antidote
MEAKVRKIGNSLGLILPKHLTDDMHLKEGDKIRFHKTESGLEMVAVDSEFEQWAEAYRQLTTDYKDVLSELAK